MRGIRIQLKREDISKLEEFELLNKIFQYSYKKDYHKLNYKQKALHNWWIISGDVGNGGLIQYFENSKGRFNSGGLKALKLIGDKKMHKIFSDAVKIFEKNKKHLTVIHYLGPLKAFEAKKLKKLDSKFFKQEDKTDKMLYSFVRTNIKDFALIR